MLHAELPPLCDAALSQKCCSLLPRGSRAYVAAAPLPEDGQQPGRSALVPKLPLTRDTNGTSACGYFYRLTARKGRKQTCDDRRHNAALEESQVLGQVKARHVTDLFASNDIR